MEGNTTARLAAILIIPFMLSLKSIKTEGKKKKKILIQG